MKFSILHPTARVSPDFESPWWKAAVSVMDGASSLSSLRDVEYILVVHQSRILDFWAAFDSVPSTSQYPLRALRCVFGRFVVVVNRGRDCLVDQSNAGQLAVTGEILIGNQDDLRFPKGWDTEIAGLIPDTSEAVFVQAKTDGGRKDLLTIPTIATKVLLDAIGLMSTDYESMFSDDEWSQKAWALAKRRQSILHFQHLHPVNGTAKMDAVYKLENRDEAYKVGFETYQKRKALGFPRIPLPGERVSQGPGLVRKALNWIIGNDGEPAAPQVAPKVIAICTPGESFPFAWVEAFLNLGSRLGQEKFIVKRYMGFSSNVYHTRADLVEKMLEDARVSGMRPSLVLWLDSDNVLLPDQLMGLLRFMEHYPDCSGVFGWCWIRKPQGWTTSVGYFWPDDGVHLMSMQPDALFAGSTDKEKWAPKPIEHSGFPCALLRYDAVEKLGSAAFRPLTKSDLPAYFEGMPYICPGCEGLGCDRCGGTGGRKPVSDVWFSGEDSSWCLAAKKAGMALAVDPGCKVGHLKLQMQEPDILAMGKMGFERNAAIEARQVGLNGPPVEAPAEYERVIS